MFLSNPFPGAFGLDIGDLSIKLVQLERRALRPASQGFKVKEIREIGLQPGLIVNGEIVQPELVRKKILHLLGKLGSLRLIQSPWVVADLPEPKTFLKLISIEAPEHDLMYEDIAYHAKKHVPFEIEDTYLDWRVIKSVPATKSTKVLLAATPKVIADSYTYLLEAAGLNPIALEIEAIPIIRSVFGDIQAPNDQTSAVIDFGATRSSLIIYDQGHIQFSTSLKFSGEILTIAISQGLKISHQAAEQIKIEQGLKYEKKNYKYLKAISPLILDLVKEIKQNLDFYYDHFEESNQIKELVLCGGAARLTNLDAVLTRKLKIPVAFTEVWSRINLSGRQGQVASGAAFASAMGLALRAIRNPLKNISV